MNVSFPNRNEMRAFSREHGIAYNDTVRDVVRLAAIAHLTDRNFLNTDCVLVGGMAMRLRGSTRFTIFDTDSSIRHPPVDTDVVADSLSLKSDDLEIESKDRRRWIEGAMIITAKPVAYRAYFAGTATAPIEDEFSLTVSERGLNMPPEWLKLVVPDYPTLTFDPIPAIPVMHLDEQTAEKILGWCGNSMAKHYSDLGWIARHLGDELNGETLREQCEGKLKVNRTLMPALRGLKEVKDLLPALAEPDKYFGPLNKEKDRRTTSVRFVGEGITLDEAKHYVRERIIPLLEPAQ